MATIKKKKYLNDELISWTMVNSLGKLRFSKASYYYIVIVPIIVKALDKVNSPFIFFGIPINLELPFSWYLFYFGALSIAIGSLLYQIFCPNLIKNYGNYGEFLNAGESDNYLNKVSRKYRNMPFDLHYTGQPYLEQKVIEKVRNSPIFNDEEEKIIDYKHNIKYQEERKNAFNKLYSDISYSNKAIIYTSLSMYVLGFSAFVWVIIQNIYFVITHLF